ncbi:MAG: C39 family peptidase [Verrucomicrobia bacterium]|nr:C39 family peptidase [Verrucomicrobiota bacterium]
MMCRFEPMYLGRPGAVLALTALVFLFAPAAGAASASGGRVVIKDVPHVRQKPDFCGEACVAMALNKLGYQVTQDHVFNLAGVDPALARGCVTRELVAVLKRIGFNPGTVWYRIRPSNAAREVESQWQALVGGLRRGVPAIVCMRTTDDADATEHFRLILGYDAATDEVLYHEPAMDNGAYQRMKREAFLSLWPLKYKPGEWLVVRMDLVVGRINVGTPATGLTAADFAQHVIALKPTVPGGFTLVIQPPFVVLGDEPADTVRKRATKTVKWFADRVRALYFAKDPPAIYDIWLLQDDESYRRFSVELFGIEAPSPFGYCSRGHGALVMNIGTGGGTLCHEMVHAFMASNFPACPAWFNEGLASLYEQCSERRGQIVGLTNWRLEGLQKTIRAGKLPSFRELLGTAAGQPYSLDGGSFYAQGRYLCYYLQEQGLLVKYYHAFVRNAAVDPGGYETLKVALGLKNDAEMDAFQKRWEQWVLRLRFP